MAKKKEKAVIELSGYPQKKQLEFFKADTKYIAYGGARGGGKSWALRRKMVLLALNYDGINILIIRRTLPELRDNHVRPLQKELKDMCTYSELHKCFSFPNGSKINLGYLDCDNDLLRYQGQEYDIIAIDEATQISEYKFSTLKACLRGANTFPKRMYLTCNPGGIGHGWVKRLFIDRQYRDGEKSNEYTFIPALVYDNEILLKHNPDYLDQLKSLSPNLKRAWLEGKWDEFEGQFFPEFDFHVHTIDCIEMPKNVKKYCAMDYGLDMLACVFVAVEEDTGLCYVYDEIHVSGKIVSEAAELINKKKDGVCMFIAPSDLWARTKDSGKSIAELFSENGIHLTKLQSDRIGGWMTLREYFKSGKLKIFRCCTELIRCLPLLLHDKVRIGDASTQPHSITHAPDALRYFAVSRYGDVFKRKEVKESKKLKEKLKKYKGEFYEKL